MQDALLEGLSDAFGFLGGALGAYWITRLLGLDLFAEGYGPGSLAAIVMVGLGGGLQPSAEMCGDSPAAAFAADENAGTATVTVVRTGGTLGAARGPRRALAHTARSRRS